MIRHVVLFKWKDEFPEEARNAWMARVRALPEKIPVIRSLTVGSDVVRSTRSYDAALVADFESVADIESYAVHPDHLPLIDISGPGSEVIASVDFELDPNH